MRSPLAVRQDELERMFRGVSSTAEPPASARAVFTLEPDQLWADTRRAQECWQPRSDLPPLLVDLTRRLAEVCGIYSVLAEDEAGDQAAGRQAATAWADAHHLLALYMRDEPRTRPYRRDLSRIRVLADLHDEFISAVMQAGISGPRFAQWLKEEAERDLSRLPYLGRVREVTHHRLINPHDRWEPNDLNDLHFLSCAAGYASVVVAERKFADYLRRAQRTCIEGALVVPSLRAATETLEHRIF
jgi:hypothetical protein